mmetsp:Transcript_38918/g.59140  ORF Transcript_38918/g.59140 Transcript_38918/m.59140 type:complete len:91 (-) Transcript_38918:2467-2739(-)
MREQNINNMVKVERAKVALKRVGQMFVRTSIDQSIYSIIDGQGSIDKSSTTDPKSQTIKLLERPPGKIKVDNQTNLTNSLFHKASDNRLA